MTSASWDNPLNEPAKETKPFVFNLSPIPAVDIRAIRSRQKALLPTLMALRDAANEALERQIALLPSANSHVKICVVYRLPDQPTLLQIFAHEFTDYPVIVPLAEKGESAAFKDLKTSSVSNLFEQDDTLGDPQFGQVTTLEKLRLLRADQQADDFRFRVVFPAMIGFVAHWIRNVEGPIHQVAFNATRPGAPKPSINVATIVNGSGHA